jgi:hypothetical protein
MGNDPAFLFYPGDWLGGTIFFTRSHKGAYMDILMAQFNNGHMALQDIQDLLGSDFNLMWESKLKAKFTQDNVGLYYNKKLEFEILKRKKYVNSRKENLKKPDNHMDSHMEAHMENENENENKDVIKDKKTIFKPPKIEEIKEYCKERKNTIDAQYFLDYQIARDWKLKGGQKMKDWKAVIRTWESNNFNTGKKPENKPAKDIFTFCTKCGARRLKSDVNENGICMGRCENATAAL